MIALTPQRTRKMLRLRRLLEAKQRADKPNWPDAAVQQIVNVTMKAFASMPIRQVRQAVAAMEKRT